MVRKVNLDLKVPLPAAEAWRLHRNFNFTSFSANIDKQAVNLVEETVAVDDGGRHQMRRTFKMVFKTDPVPNALRGVLKTEQIEPIMREVWIAEVYEDEYSYQFTSDMAFFGEKLKVSGRQWFKPIGDSVCAYHSRAEVHANYFPGMNGLLERAAAEKLEWAMSTFGDRAVLFLQQLIEQQPDASVPASPRVTMSSPARSQAPGSLSPKDVWLPMHDFYDAATVATAPIHQEPGSAPLATALELDDLAGDARVPCACCCSCFRQLQKVTSSYVSLGKDAAQRERAPRVRTVLELTTTEVGVNGRSPRSLRSRSTEEMRAPTSMVLQRSSKAQVEAETMTMPIRRAVDDEAADEEDFGEIID